jgi:hypothetical protein
VSTQDEDKWGWNLVCGYHRVYTDEAQYLKECSVPNEELIDGLPNLNWTVACLI